MQFALLKCAKASFRKGKLTKATNVKLDETCVIQELAHEVTYNCLSIDEGNGIKNAAMKEKVRKEYYRRIKMILKSELNKVNNDNDTKGAPALPSSSYFLGTQNRPFRRSR